MMNLNNLTSLKLDVYENAKEHGWWDGTVRSLDDLAKRLNLIHAEVSEAVEELRSGHGEHEIYFNSDHPDKPEGFVIELADVVIRILDLCTGYDLPIEHAIELKHEYNKTRPYKHGNKAF